MFIHVVEATGNNIDSTLSLAVPEPAVSDVDYTTMIIDHPEALTDPTNSGELMTSKFRAITLTYFTKDLSQGKFICCYNVNKPCKCK